jgi:hypothetical protein
MDYSQFRSLLERGNISGKENIGVLQEYVNEFPYFQSAHILLAKAMHEQQHVRYEKQLKLAAAYSGDRKLLYDLMHPKSEQSSDGNREVIDSPFLSFSETRNNSGQNIFIDEIGISVIPPEEEKAEVIPIINPETINSRQVFYSDDFDSVDEEEDETPVADPHDIIRKRLVEILGLSEEKPEPKPVVSEGTPAVKEPSPAEEVKFAMPVEIPEEKKEVKKEEIIAKTEDKDIFDQIATESEKVLDFIDKAELESALEVSLVQSLEKLPLLIKKEEIAVSQPEEITAEHTFLGWLKTKSGSEFGKVEEVHAYDTTETIEQPIQSTVEFSVKPETETKKNQVDTLMLIDKFIESNPKIVPSKAEFYSPANQAKKSVTEDEDLVSETLAEIYRMQGNLLKARSSYQKLSLLFPEKLTYFAAQISDIDQAINNLNKQDL